MLRAKALEDSVVAHSNVTSVMYLTMEANRGENTDGVSTELGKIFQSVDLSS